MVYNPFFRKLQTAESGEKAATYSGIAVKGIWFSILTLVGVAAYFYLPPFTNSMHMLIGTTAVAVLCPLIIFWVPSTTPVLGTVYSVVQGYLVGLVSTQYAKEYSGIVLMALGITAIVVLSLFFLYASGIIKVGHKFKAFISTLFLGSILASGIIFVSSYFFPAMKTIFYGNSMVSLIVAVVVLLITALNLISEFDHVAQTVNRRLCKKYEWQAAYGLVMTIVILFLRILRVLAIIFSKGKENR